MSKWVPRIGRRYEATRLPLDEPFVQESADAPGTLLRIRPYPEERALARTVDLFRSIHTVTTNWRGTNTSDRHSFELWFHEGRLTFYVHAATASAAETIHRHLESAYPSSEVTPVETGPTFPTIDPDDAVAGARVSTRNSPVYPIRQHDAEGFETDPYAELTSEMVTSDECTVLVQFVFRPAKRTWTNGGRAKNDGVDAIAHERRQGHLVGWLNPTIRPAGTIDERIAALIERQRTRPAYHVAIRVAAWSTDEAEATARAEGVAGMFGQHYTGITEQELVDDPIWSRWRGRQANRLHRHVTRMADREWIDRRTILTVDELAGIAHLPSNDVRTPNIDWRAVRSGESIAAEAARPADRQFDTTARYGGGDGR